MEWRPTPTGEDFVQVLLQIYPDAERTEDGSLLVAPPRGVLLKVTEDRLEVSLPQARRLDKHISLVHGGRVLHPAGFWGARTIAGFREVREVMEFIEPAFPAYTEIDGFTWFRCQECGRPLQEDECVGVLAGDVDVCAPCYQVVSGRRSYLEW